MAASVATVDLGVVPALTTVLGQARPAPGPGLLRSRVVAIRLPRKIDTFGADLDDTLRKTCPISAAQGRGALYCYARLGQGSSNPALLYRAWEFFQDSPL